MVAATKSPARLPVFDKFIEDLRALWAREPDILQRRMELGRSR